MKQSDAVLEQLQLQTAALQDLAAAQERQADAMATIATALQDLVAACEKRPAQG